MNTLNKTKGMTLLEVMLVLVIVTSMILAGFRVFQSYDKEKNYILLKSNVDFLFQAMKGYYHTQCDLYFSADGVLREKGTLTFNPDSVPVPPNLVPVSFDVSTVSNYMSGYWPRHLAIVYSPETIDAYQAQFNPLQGGNKSAYSCSYFGSGSPLCGSAVIPNSNVILWQSQIVVKMKDPTQTVAYVALAGADCAVNIGASTTTVPAFNCSVDGIKTGSATHMVWQRTPSFSSPNIRSSHWVSNPMVKQFKLQYTHDPMYEMYRLNDTTPTDIYKYYYCGG